ncbi:FHA domain protein [Roseateles sp. YR242]|uniref:type VI secretion system-associated FHA domain protein TagH n=1 Tax=Roseateles sp. YR242 TaxID=1855305 RepID=UPI0008CF507F|nr:type VI secretion system-associated FHA domain protein TagH [Roseateles sp. YR242]SEL36374.1 FHA domain protein [Roseateles sp. YR242]
MTLTLRAVSLNDLPLTQPITAQFGAQGGTIGRADSNTMALPDPERHISRQQAEIRGAPGGYLIFNIGSANPITVRGQSLAQGQSLPLRDRDEVRIGGYLLEVVENTADDTNVALAPRPAATPAALGHAHGLGGSPAAAGWPAAPLAPAAAPVPAPMAAPVAAPARAPASDPFADLMGGGGSAGASSNPFADLLGSPPPPAPRSAFGESFKAAPVAAPPPTMGLLPDDFDPFAPPPPPRAVSAPAASNMGFGGLGAPVASPPPPSRGGHEFSAAGAFADLIPTTGAGPSSLDDMFGLKPGASESSDPLAGFMAEATRGGASDALSTDPMALFGDAPPVAKNTEPVTPALPDHTSALSSSFRPPEVRRPRPLAEPEQALPDVQPAAAGAAPRQEPALQPTPGAIGRAIDDGFDEAAAPMVMASETGATISAPPAAARAAPRPSIPTTPVPPTATVLPTAAPVAAPSQAAAAPGAAAGHSDAAALWQAFSEGAGIRFDPPQGLNPDLMRIVGQLLRSSVEGTLQMMSVRAATKHELRAQVTIIRSRDNNPLKFSPDAQSALEQLLQPPVRGFLPGPAAMSDAMHDLVGHTIGTMAGTRAALEGVLGRFKPEMLESKLTSRSVLDSVLTLNRKAKLWELYLQHFESIREEAQEDFHNLFGKAFLEAYEEQLERLNQRKTAA